MHCVGFEVLTAVVMKSSMFWDITPCNPLEINRRFGGTFLHLQGRRMSQARNYPSGFTQISCLLFSDLEDGDDIFPRIVG
jgi:hypothetical protein